VHGTSLRTLTIVKVVGGRVVIRIGWFGPQPAGVLSADQGPV